MGTSFTPGHEPVEAADEPGTDREPETVWDFRTAVTEDDFSAAARERRAVRLDPDVLRALDREAGQ